MRKVPSKVKEIRECSARMERGARSISFSQLSVYHSCPKRWQRAYLLKEVPFEPNIHLVFGTSFHETLQYWLSVLYENGVKAAELLDLNTYLLERMKVNYGHDRDILKADFSNAKEMQEFYQDGVEILKYIQKHRKAFFSSSKTWLVGCEIPILYKLRPGFYFKGFIDILTHDEETGKWKIWDIKTSTNGWKSETKKDFIKTSQILLYREFLSKQFGIDPGSIEIEYFIVKRKITEDAPYPAMRKRVQEFVPSHGPRVSKRAVDLVDSFISGALTETGEYQEREYETVPSKEHCKWCLFKDSCKEACV